MNRAEIIAEYRYFLKRHPLPAAEFVIGAGGACVMLGIREVTDDMDMGVRVKLYEQLRDSGKYATHVFQANAATPACTVVAWNDNIDLHPLEEGETAMVDGVCCYSPARLLAQKLNLNRPKDQADIAALRRLISQQ